MKKVSIHIFLFMCYACLCSLYYTGWPRKHYPSLSLKIVTGRGDIANYFKNKSGITYVLINIFASKFHRMLITSS